MLYNPNDAYYQVGQDTYYSKIEALIAATKTNTHPTWHFADHVWERTDWTRDFNLDLRSLYQARARQLRESYDYLVLAYSGGSDSRAILDSFLGQGLYPDEIIHSWPIEGTKNLYTPSADPYQFLNEWDFVAKPDLEWLAQNHPEIKITIHDFSGDMLKDDAVIQDEDWMRNHDFMCPNVPKKHGIMTQQERLRVDAGQKTALIQGFEKPQVAYRDGKLYTYFLDKFFGNINRHQRSWRTTEMFYWTPDMPELVQQRARAVYHHFLAHPEHLWLVDWDKRKQNKSRQNKQKLDDLIRSIVYPDWNPNRFQAYKSSNLVWNENDQWFFTHFRHTRYFQSWISGVTHLESSIDKKFQEHSAVNGRFEGWVGFVSRFYCLGEIRELRQE